MIVRGKMARHATLRELKTLFMNVKENDNALTFTKHVSTETSVIFSWLIYKALEVEFKSRGKNANYTSNGMYIKRDNVRIKRIILDLYDVIADSKKVVLYKNFTFWKSFSHNFALASKT